MPTDTPTANPRYCDECRFFRAVQSGLTYARCGHPKAATQSSDHLVSRALDVPDHSYCSTARSMAHMCGESGSWFEGKPAAEAA